LDSIYIEQSVLCKLNPIEKARAHTHTHKHKQTKKTLHRWHLY